MVITHKNCFKIKRLGSEGNIRKLTDLYGGSIVNDFRNLDPGELWYHTNCDIKTLKLSGLVEVLEQLPLRKRQEIQRNETLLSYFPED